MTPLASGHLGVGVLVIGRADERVRKGRESQRRTAGKCPDGRYYVPFLTAGRVVPDCAEVGNRRRQPGDPVHPDHPTSPRRQRKEMEEPAQAAVLRLVALIRLAATSHMGAVLAHPEGKALLPSAAAVPHD